MKIEIGARTAKTFVKALEKLNEESLIVFDKEGIRTRILDVAHTHLLDIRIPKEGVTEYIFGGSDATELGVVIARIKDLTKTLTVKDTLSISYKPNDPTWLHLSANGVDKTVRLLNTAHMKRVSIPQTDHKWSGKLPMKELKAFLTALDKTAHFEVIVDKSISFVAKTNDGESRIDFDADEIDFHSEGGNYETTLTTTCFLDLLAATSMKTVIEIQGGDGGIVETAWNEADMNLKGWVAPRSGE